MIILGLNTFHGDAAAAIIKNGELVAAAEEERFRRIKHWAGFPTEAIRYCLSEARVGLNDVDVVALNHHPWANLPERIRYVLLGRASLKAIVERIRNRSAREGVVGHIKNAFPDMTSLPQIEHVEHHLAHLSSAFLVSPFDEAVVVSVDGFGDFASTAWGIGRKANIDIEDRVLFPHSLGVFYQAITQYLGFPNYGDEYKIMGLAPYGQPRFVDQMRQLLRIKNDGRFELDLSFFRHHSERIGFQLEFGAPKFADLFSPALEALFGSRRRINEPLEQRHKDIARSAQDVYEEAFFNLLNVLHDRHNISNIALAGGCAANSVANGKIYRMTPFKKVFVQAAAGDAGGALGAAFAAWHKRGGGRSFVMNHAYWGPQFDTDYLRAIIESRRAQIESANCSIETFVEDRELCRRVAKAVAAGNVIGWFQGRMEWGPRALGNRSIICDPRRADIKDILNSKIKRRESFRPFAPSILAEFVSDWFEEGGDVPFMMQVFQIREEKRSQIPAVSHIDGSGRLQTVEKTANPRYYELISAFRDLTGVPMVLNTSFNENEPLVCKPEEALDCFIRTNMDVLVLGDIYITRR